MKKGKVKIAPVLIADALKFPVDWKIKSIQMKEGDSYATAIISGFDFPEVPENGDPVECMLIVHVEQRRFEVKEIPK